jgi:hypothetical protein
MFICNTCSNVYTRRHNLNNHIKIKHPKNVEVDSSNSSVKRTNKNYASKQEIGKMIFKSMSDINHTFNSTNECSSSVLNEIAKACKNIKHKLNVLKNEEAHVQSLVEHTFKPIIEPLTEISDKYFNTNDLKIVNYDTIESKIEEDLLNYKKEEETNNPYEEKNQTRFNKWFRSTDLDRIYGPKELFNGQMKLGEKEIIFDGNALIIEDNLYSITPGLEQLLFLKNPKLYTSQDLTTYKQILTQTSAHLTANGYRIKKGGIKCMSIIEKLFPSGEGMKYGCLKLQENDLIDPNKLVDRLRMLMKYRDEGDISVSNEILAIFEELYEADIIKRIPNV